MAEVFAGHSMGDHGFQKPVAIKQLLPELANDHVFVERLISEAKLLVGMQHGNIVSVLDLARDGDDVFLVMEFVDGPSLRQLLKARGARGLPLGVSTYILQSAAQGLEFAHARPGGAVIHADISPSNLLLTTSGEVRVADFGIARREGLGQGVVEGKWAYMAPEQARGEPLTPRSDVFALGVVLYELLTGAHPFGRQVTADERDNHEPMRVIPPRVVKPTVPPGLDTICMRCLSHDPRARYARMQEVIDALTEERFANGYREGASDLATAIREVQPQPAVHQPRTMITDRPVTIVTRSLLSQPKRQKALGTPLLPSVERISKSTSKLTDARGSALEIPPLARADGTPMPPFRLRPASLPGEDLASVVGGNTVTGSGIVELPARNHRVTFMILGIAALVGAVAAIAIQLSPNSIEDERMAAPSGIWFEPLFTHPVMPPPAPPVVTEISQVEAVKPDEVKPDEVKPEAAKLDEVKPEAKPVETEAKPADAKPDPTVKVDEAKPIVTRHAVTIIPTHVAPVAHKRDPGILRVSCEPWCYVELDGDHGSRQESGGSKFTLTPGKHTVRLSTESGQHQTRFVTIESGKNKILRVNMESTQGEE